jgi:hypothetical protein
MVTRPDGQRCCWEPKVGDDARVGQTRPKGRAQWADSREREYGPKCKPAAETICHIPKFSFRNVNHFPTRNLKFLKRIHLF